RELHAGDLAKSRVRLLGRGRVDAGAHAAPLGAPLERRSLGLAGLVLSALADQLLDRGHRFSELLVAFCNDVVVRAVKPGPTPALGCVATPCGHHPGYLRKAGGSQPEHVRSMPGSLSQRTCP